MKVSIKKAVKVALAQRGMNQNDFATALGVHPSTLSGNLTLGNPSLRVLERWADVLELKPSALLALGEE